MAFLLKTVTYLMNEGREMSEIKSKEACSDYRCRRLKIAKGRILIPPLQIEAI